MLPTAGWLSSAGGGGGGGGANMLGSMLPTPPTRLGLCGGLVGDGNGGGASTLDLLLLRLPRGLDRGVDAG